jgi:branched-chain amino acid transport system permease protein
MLLAVLLLYSPLGMRARATREEPTAATAIGINVRRLQVSLFAIGAALASVAGSVYAGTIGFIDPTTFTLHSSILILSMVVVGGIGNPFGVFIGGVVIASLPAFVQEFDIGAVYAAALQQMLFGFIMVVMVIVRPSGLFPETLLRRAPENA